MRGPKRLLARHGAQADEERNGRTPVRKLVATFCAVAMSVGMAGVSMSAYADDQQPAEDATTTVEATPEVQPTEDATVDAQPEAEATDAAEADAQPEAVTADAPTVLAAGDADQSSKKGSKTITEVGDNQYVLNVGLTGGDASTDTQSQKVDVVFVVDKSSSMNYGLNSDSRPQNGSPTRWSVSKTAITNLSSKLLAENKDPNDPIHRVAIVSYGTDLLTNAGDATQGFVTSQEMVEKALSSNPGSGQGTNWEAGLKQAIALPSTATKYIIFISDGAPTFRLTKGAECGAFNWGECREYQSGVYGNGSSDRNGYNFDAAVAMANTRESSSRLYTVRAVANQDLAATMNNFAARTNSVSGAAYNGSNATDLNNVFNDIFQAITSRTVTKITSISDTLSEWVEPGWTEGEDIGKYVSVVGPDANTIVDPSKYTVVMDGRTVTVTFNPAVVASSSQTYALKINVRPSDTAFQQWGDNLNNGTNDNLAPNPVEGKPAGLPSNTSASASYELCTTTTTGTTTGTENCVRQDPFTEYDVPVLHPVFTNVTTDFMRVQKTVKGSKGWDVNDTFQFTIAKAAGTPGNTPLPQYTTLTVSKNGDSNTATGNFGQITYDTPGTYRYTVSEVKGKGSYQYSQAAYLVTVKVTADGNSKSLVAAIDSVQQTKDADTGADLNPAVPSQMPMAFVNQNAMVTLDANTIGVKKTVQGANAPDKTFTFTLMAVDTAQEGLAENEIAGKAQDVTGLDDANSTVTVNYTSDGQWTPEANFTATPTFPVPSDRSKTAVYTFQIAETQDATPGWSYDKNPTRTVKVNVSYDSQNKTWNAVPASADLAVQNFTNTWVAVSNLPLTGEGGVTPMLWLAIGGGLGALALLAAGGAAIWRKPRLV